MIILETKNHIIISIPTLPNVIFYYLPNIKQPAISVSLSSIN